jgi:Flp pilus assembly pilin Flp
MADNGEAAILRERAMFECEDARRGKPTVRVVYHPNHRSHIDMLNQHRGQTGATMVEYALLVALITVVAIVVLTNFTHQPTNNTQIGTSCTLERGHTQICK